MKPLGHYYLDIDPHEDIARIAAMLIIVLILGVLVALDKMPVESFVARGDMKMDQPCWDSLFTRLAIERGLRPPK